MSPLVEESWEVTAEASRSSGSIFLASCLPSSTLGEQTGSGLGFAGRRLLIGQTLTPTGRSC